MQFQIIKFHSKIITKKKREKTEAKVKKILKQRKYTKYAGVKKVEVLGLLINNDPLTRYSADTHHENFKKSVELIKKQFGKDASLYGPFANQNVFPEITEARRKATKQDVPNCIVDYLIVKITY